MSVSFKVRGLSYRKMSSCWMILYFLRKNWKQ